MEREVPSQQQVSLIPHSNILLLPANAAALQREQQRGAKGVRLGLKRAAGSKRREHGG